MRVVKLMSPPEALTFFWADEEGGSRIYDLDQWSIEQVDPVCSFPRSHMHSPWIPIQASPLRVPGGSSQSTWLINGVAVCKNDDPCWSRLLLSLVDCFLLRRLSAIALYHDYAQQAPNNCWADQHKNDWYANCPDSGWKVRVERVVWVNKRLQCKWSALCDMRRVVW